MAINLSSDQVKLLSLTKPPINSALDIRIEAESIYMYALSNLSYDFTTVLGKTTRYKVPRHFAVADPETSEGEGQNIFFIGQWGIGQKGMPPGPAT